MKSFYNKKCTVKPEISSAKYYHAHMWTYRNLNFLNISVKNETSHHSMMRAIQSWDIIVANGNE